MSSETNPLERNLQLFPRYKAATSVSPWLPLFFLYFVEIVPLGEAVLLSSAYYFSVFLLEVPSGYCSDRFGRRSTLMLASLMTMIACALFAFANSFLMLLAAQVLLAAGIAFQSGSDSALLYDSLRAQSREQEYTERESTAQKWSMNAMASSCLVGGVLGLVDFRLAYVVSSIAALIAVVHCVAFTEPAMEGETRATGFVTQLKVTLGYFCHPMLAWILGFFILGFALEHIPFEFYQPYLKLLAQDELIGWLASSSAPMASAVVMSISMFGGAIGAALSQRLINKVGLRTLLLASIAVQLVIISGLSLLLHPIMLVLVLFRNFSMSMARGPMLGAIAPHVSNAQRATFLSLLSLSGRATFSLVLALFSIAVVGKEALNWFALSQILAVSAATGMLALLLLYVWSRRLMREFDEAEDTQRDH